MKAPYPFGYIGEGVTRCVVLALPAWKVQRMLPPNLELGEQDVLAKGAHPVVLQFHDFSHCRFSVPSLLQPLNFHEQTLGVPFTRISSRYGGSAGLGPFYFMPKLYLDDLWVWTVGRNLWGFDKEMAGVNVTKDRYTVTNSAGRRLVSVGWSGEGASAPLLGLSGFESIRRMLSQTLISLSPAGVGPFFALTDFNRDWSHAAVRRLKAVMDVDPCYVRGFEGGRFATDAEGADREHSIVGSYEVSAQWWLSFPYLP